ncbi:porin [Cardiobacterium sp. AH-315-I02]|nr:porin [Cardiobacterium sp. AH-315-I02]
MKKSILAIAVAATMAAPAAMAAPTVYGNVHLSIVDLDSLNNLVMTSNTSAVGVKGSEDLGDGLKAIYKVEFQLDATGSSGNGDALTQRDVFAGVKGGMGTIKLGAMSSNYKQKGGKVDSLYRTPVEGRGFLDTQSSLHNGRAINRGRMTNQLQYSSPKMGGVQLVANTTFSNSDDETIGVGVRYETKGILAFADYIDAQPLTGGAGTETAFKIGGKYSAKAFHVAGQYEAAEDVTGFDFIHVNAGFNINANNSIQVTAGTATHITAGALDTTSFAVAYVHSLSKMTMLYAAYGDKSSDTAASEESAFALGIRKKF